MAGVSGNSSTPDRPSASSNQAASGPRDSIRPFLTSSDTSKHYIAETPMA